MARRDETLSVRTARKKHECHAHPIFQLWGKALRCDGTINPGDRYYDDRRDGWEILRYHVCCGAYGGLPEEEPENKPEIKWILRSKIKQN